MILKPTCKYICEWNNLYVGDSWNWGTPKKSFYFWIFHKIHPASGVPYMEPPIFTYQPKFFLMAHVA